MESSTDPGARIDRLAVRDRRAARRLLPRRDAGRRCRLRLARGRAARADRRPSRAGAGSESARERRRAGDAARPRAPQPADAVAGEGEHAGAGGGVLRPLPRPARGGHAEARRALARARLRERDGCARAVTRGDGTTGDDVTVLVRALADGVPDAIEAAGRAEVRGELVMLRSTFAAYNAAHPDKPLINPRGAAAGTLRAKDPAVVAERRLRFFAFDLETTDGAEADLEQALRTLGFDAADMRHCDDAAAAQEVIAAIEARAQRARLRPRRRRAAARRPQRLRRRRHALQQPARRAGVQVRRRGEDDAARRRRLGRRQDRQGRARSPCSSRCSSAGRRCRARRSPTRR